jgi:hypothetical protein
MLHRNTNHREATTMNYGDQRAEGDALHAEYERRAAVAQTIPTPEELLADPCAPVWAKDVIRVALQKDFVDASGVFDVLAKSFAQRTDKLLGR